MADVNDGRVRYARNGDIRLAYRVFGDNDTPLVFMPPYVSNVDLYDDTTTPFAPFKEQLARDTTLIVWDKRGNGLSDPTDHVPTIDERMDDMHAVLDACGVESAALAGGSEGGPLSLMFAGTYPERVQSLVLYGTAARYSQAPDFPWGCSPEQIAEQVADIEANWGEGALADVFLGDAAEIPGVRELWGRFQRAGASPTMARLTWQAVMEIDVRGVLGSIRTPTRVLAREGDRLAPPDAAHALASAIPGAEFRMMPPGPHLALDAADILASEILEFVLRRARSSPSDRVLTTVLFTDIVGSTEQLDAQGDERWRQQLDAHDRLVDILLAKYQGHREKHTGDGVFARFDGPTRAARCSLELVSALATRGIRIRAGVHTGECERRGDEWSGMAVHIGARIGAMAGAGEVFASRTVRDLSVGSGLHFDSLGLRQLKGLAEETEVFRVT